MPVKEIVEWQTFDEMTGIFKALKTADPALPDGAILEMVDEEQEANGWIGRYK